MDSNGDGTLSKTEIKEGFKLFYGDEMNDDMIEQIFFKTDFDKNGQISYSEFIVATMNKQELLDKENLKAAFDLFDTDQSGFISKEEICKVLTFGSDVDDANIKGVMEQIDIDKDGEISFEEFTKMMLEKIEELA